MKSLLLALASGTVLHNRELAGNALSKVVKKLESMLEQSKTDGEADVKAFATFKCKSNTALEDANAAIKESTNTIAVESGRVEQLRGQNGKLSQEIASLTQQLLENQDQQDAATAERDQQKDDYADKKTDLEGAISQLGDAVKLLADIGADQTAESRDTADRDRFVKKALISVTNAVKVLPKDEKSKQVLSFLEAPFSGTYTSQSSEIIGILKNQKDTFENDLDVATKLEDKHETW